MDFFVKAEDLFLLDVPEGQGKGFRVNTAAAKPGSKRIRIGQLGLNESGTYSLLYPKRSSKIGAMRLSTGT